MSHNDELKDTPVECYPDVDAPDLLITPPIPKPVGRLQPEAEAALSESDNIRIDLITRDRMILYPAMVGVQAQADWLFNEPIRMRARGLVICSRAGNGKTSLAQAMSRRFSSVGNGDESCALMISMAGVRDARTVYGRILETLGSPARVSHRLSDRELLVTRLLKVVNCRLLILDEVQDLLLGSEREQQRALEAIKFLMNERCLPVLAFGTEKAGQGFGSDPHLAARFKEFTLPLWKADNTLANFLATYERFLPLKKVSNLATPDKVALLAKLGNGVLDNIIQRVQNAALMAIANGSEHITLDLLKQADSRPAACPLGKSKSTK